MTDRLIVDLGPDGRVSVSSWPKSEQLPSPAGEPFNLVWPLNGEDLEDLRWYLEDYLRAPYGVYEERGPEVAAALAGWGRAVFESIFGSGPVRDAYTAARARTGVGTEIVFRSSAAAMLGLPWELLHDPSRPTPVALDMVDVTRSIPTAELGEAFAARGERLRVLMVISRPAGGEDVGYRMIARPLLERLDAVRGRVELVVLRPPTLDALERVLADALANDQPFQVVHFDGHGVLPGRRGLAPDLGAPLTFEGSNTEGVLVFEKPMGGPDEIPVASLAQVLKKGQVPLVVLNACQSGAVGKELEAAVATRLLQEGVGSVVAMAYAVYAVAAAEFMAAFYERLFAGEGVTAAVSAGRRRLHRRDDRPSPKGQMPLADWVVPVHYLRREVHFPYLQTEPSDRRPLGEALDSLREHSGTDGGVLEPVGSFVGRDALFYELEVAARLQRVVLLHGPGGTGKTELAKAFGRWWRDTGGVQRPEWVIVHSFEPGVTSFGLDGVISEIGLTVFGADFARRGPAKGLAEVERVLKEGRLLLIWDNFEAVFTMPDPTEATPTLDEAGRRELRTFLQRLAGDGCSSVILTSRTEEAWLGELRRIEVGGLAPHEAIEYADRILAPFPATAPRRDKPTFAHLLEWLDGHPLSMRLVLPHLKASEPEALLAGLQGTGELPGVVGESGGRTSSLEACVNYSYEHLSPRARGLLAAVCLFHGVADVTVLAALSTIPDVPERFSGFSKQTWTEALDEAAGVGLLSALGGDMYQIHPALPTYLAAQWHREEPDGYERQRDAATRALLAAYAGFGVWLAQQIQSSQAGVAFALVDRQRRTLGHLLGFALDAGLWMEAHAIAEPLMQYLTGQGRYEETRAWVDRARLALEDRGAPPEPDGPDGALWLFFSGFEASRQLRSYELEDAERTYRGMLDFVETQAPSDKRQQVLATIYHSLGIVAQERGNLDDAESRHLESRDISEKLDDQTGMAGSDHQLAMVAQERGNLDDAESLYLKSLAIREKLGDQPEMAKIHHQLGNVALLRGDPDDAESWCLKSLATMEKLNNQPGMAIGYHQLGMVAQERWNPDDAENWYLKSLAIEEKLGDQLGMAASYHQLGNVALKRGDPDNAENWYLESLAILEKIDNQPGMAKSCHQLGMVAQERWNLDDAENWYLKSLAILEKIDNQPEKAISCHQLGTVAQERGNPDDAENWYLKSLAITEKLGSQLGMAKSYYQLSLLAESRGQAPAALEWAVRCVALFDEIPHPAAGPSPAHLARLTSKLGVDALEQSWRQVVGADLPPAIRDFVQSYPLDDDR